MTKIPLSIGLIAALLTCNLLGESDNHTSPEDILKNLQTLLKANKSLQEQALSKALEDFSNASKSNATALALYKEAVQKTEFEGKREGSALFYEWKDKEEKRLENKVFQDCIRLQLEYLTLSLRRIMGEKVKDLNEPLVDYVNHYIEIIQPIEEAPEPLREKDISGKVKADSEKTAEIKDREKYVQQYLKAAIDANNPFIKLYLLEDDLKKLKNWEMAPGNIHGIYEKTLLPYYRKQKDKRLIEYWDNAIGLEQKKLDKKRIAFESEKFELITKPQMAWNRATEFIHLGNYKQAMIDMFVILKDRKDHPKFEDWSSDLEHLCKEIIAKGDNASDIKIKTMLPAEGEEVSEEEQIQNILKAWKAKQIHESN